MNTDNTLLLLAFGTFSTALVLCYLIAHWTRPLFAWTLVLLGGAATIGCVVASEVQADSATGTTGAGVLILAGIIGIATMGALIGAGYGTWKARG